MNRKLRLIALLTPTVLLWGMPSDVSAQSRAQPPMLEEITVTAQRREQGVQNVPLAVTAWSDAQIESRQISETLDVVPYIPNSVAQNNTGPGGANAYFIRGLGSSQSLATFDSPVGTYVDDLFVARQAANNFAFFDLERIEVLRGPQGTLFGRNTTGGAVRVILKKPADVFGGYAEAGYGRFNRVSLRGSVDLPLGERLFSKLSGYYIDDDGYVDNRTTGDDDFNSEKNRGLRGAIRASLGSSATWDLAADYVDNWNAYLLNFKDGGDRFTLSGIPKNGGTLISPVTGGPLLTGAKNDFAHDSLAKTFSVQSNLSFTFDVASLEIITTYLDTEQKLLLDIFNGGVGAPGDDIPAFQTSLPPGSRGSFGFSTGGFAFAQFGDSRQFTQEVKFNGEMRNGAFRYVAGAYYFDEDNTTELGQVFSVAALGGFPLVLGDFSFDNDTRSWALYAQGDLEIGEKTTLTVGMRYTDEEKTIAMQDFQPAGNASDHTTANLVAAGIPTRLDTALLTPRVAIAYRFTDDAMMFASATRGFKSGGWNASATAAQQILPFSEEKVWSYELGLRSDWLDNRLRVNATAFFLDVADFQVLSAFVNANGSLTFLTRNFADMENSGLELEVSASLTSNLDLYGTLGLQDAKHKIDRNVPEFDEFGVKSVAAQQRDCLDGVAAACGAGIVTPDGQIAEPTRTPDVTASLGLHYEHPLSGSGGRLFFDVNARYFSDHPRGTSNPDFSFTGSVVTMDGALGYHSADDRWSLVAQCKNCTDKAYIVSTIGALGWINDPMTWSLSLKHRFGGD